MFKEGTIGIPKGDKYIVAHYWVKVFEKGSEYGINNGRISKLTIKIDGTITASYDRGWDIKPAEEDEATQLAYCILLQNYN